MNNNTRHLVVVINESEREFLDAALGNYIYGVSANRLTGDSQEYKDMDALRDRVRNARSNFFEDAARIG